MSQLFARSRDSNTPDGATRSDGAAAFNIRVAMPRREGNNDEGNDDEDEDLDVDGRGWMPLRREMLRGIEGRGRVTYEFQLPSFRLTISHATRLSVSYAITHTTAPFLRFRFLEPDITVKSASIFAAIGLMARMLGGLLSIWIPETRMSNTRRSWKFCSLTFSRYIISLSQGEVYDGGISSLIFWY